jgi:CHAD domain-containing protein
MTTSLAQRALARRVRALERELPAALEGDVEGLHRSRVASRRLREILPVLGLQEDPGRRAPVRKLRRRLRQLTSALGGVRELDVALGILDSLRLDHPDLDEVISVSRRAVEADRRECQDEMARQMEEVQVAALFEEFAGLIDAAGRASRKSRALLLRRRLERRVDRLDAAIADAGSLFSVERLHQVRIGAKQLRYALELIHEFGGVPTLRLVNTLKRFQDLLGRLHDLEVVAGYLQRAREEEQGRHAAAADRASNLLDREMRELHARYLATGDRLDRLVAICRDEIDRRLWRSAAGPVRRRRPWRKTIASTSSDTRSPRSAARSTRTTPSGR